MGLLLLITAITMQLGWRLKARCHVRPWDDYQWREHCYSDVQALYRTRGVADGTWPYVETFNEYPPLTGLFMHVMGELSSSKEGYLLVSALALGLVALAVTWLLAEHLGRDRRILYWAAAPALAVYAFYNWDLLAVAPAVGALLAFRKGHMGLAGALLGLGASAKLFPAFLAPALGMWILREDGGLKARGWRFGLGFAAVAAAIHVPLFLLNFDLTLEAYRFQARRLPNFETIYYSLAHLGREWRGDWLWLDHLDDKPYSDLLSLGPFALSLAFSGWAAWTRRLDPVAAACVPVFVFLAVNKVFSVQYVLWALPLLMLTGASRTHKVLVVVADLAVFVTLSNYFALWNVTQDGHLFTPVAFAVLFRAAVFASVAWSLARPAWRKDRDLDVVPGDNGVATP